jgi:hypothetical protein
LNDTVFEFDELVLAIKLKLIDHLFKLGRIVIHFFIVKRQQMLELITHKVDQLHRKSAQYPHRDFTFIRELKVLLYDLDILLHPMTIFNYQVPAFSKLSNIKRTNGNIRHISHIHKWQMNLQHFLHFPRYYLQKEVARAEISMIL